jgi:hypothetical protein
MCLVIKLYSSLKLGFPCVDGVLCVITTAQWHVILVYFILADALGRCNNPIQNIPSYETCILVAFLLEALCVAGSGRAPGPTGEPEREVLARLETHNRAGLCLFVGFSRPSPSPTHTVYSLATPHAFHLQVRNGVMACVEWRTTAGTGQPAPAAQL